MEALRIPGTIVCGGGVETVICQGEVATALGGLDAAVGKKDGMHAGGSALFALVDIVDRGCELEEHGQDGYYGEDGDVPYDGCGGIRCAEAEGPDIAYEDLGWVFVEEVHGEGSSD